MIRRLARHPLAVGGMAFLGLLAMAAVLVPWLPMPDPLQQDIAARLQPPAWRPGGTMEHLLGTDHVGRDILSRIVWSSRITVPLGIAAATVSLAYGTALGLIAAYRGGLLSDGIMRTADIQHAFPFMVIAIAVVAAVGPSIPALLATLSLWGWVYYARIARGEALRVLEEEYVQASVTVGSSARHILWRHVLPNVSSPLIVIWTFTVAEVVLLESGLSFLGLGVPPPSPTWGNMLSEGRAYMSGGWWVTVFPGLAIMLTVLAVNVVGDAVRDVLDPRSLR